MAVKKIFVVGSGFMGAGIAQVGIAAGYDVTMMDVSKENAEKSASNIDSFLAKNVSKGKMTQNEKDAAMANLKTSTTLKDAANTDMVIEAAVERADVKKSIFAE